MASHKNQARFAIIECVLRFGCGTLVIAALPEAA
jgi:hypothetical protein